MNATELEYKADAAETLPADVQQVLVSERFRPQLSTSLTADQLGDELDWPDARANATLELLADEGFLTPQDPSRLSPPRVHWKTHEDGWYVSEELHRRARLRRPPLLSQCDYLLENLVLALLYVPIARNARLPAGFLAEDTQVFLLALHVYLPHYSRERLLQACCALAADRLLANGGGQSGAKGPSWVLTNRGLKRYREQVAPLLKLRDDECVLDAGPRALQVFFAWQCENRESRNILGAIVQRVVKELNDRDTLLCGLELVMATEPGNGALRIDVAVQERILRADYFVGDLTPVYHYGGRLRVNENVLVETGFALGAKDPGQVVLLEYLEAEVPGDGSPNPQPTFDIGHVKRLKYRDKAHAYNLLRTELAAMLKRDGWEKK